MGEKYVFLFVCYKSVCVCIEISIEIGIGMIVGIVYCIGSTDCIALWRVGVSE